MFCVIVIFICGNRVRGKERLLEIQIMFVCDCDINL
jgi:hypothetical protein